MSERKKMRLPKFTERFREKVESIGSIAKVSEMTKISRTTLNFWYNGQRTPDAENLITLSNCFNVSAGFLLGIEEDPTNDPAVRIMHEYTGLSSNTIQKIHDIDEKNHFLTSSFSAFVDDECFADLLEFLNNYGKATNSESENVDVQIGELSEVFPKEMMMEWMKAGAQMVFSKILERYPNGGGNNGKH